MVHALSDFHQRVIALRGAKLGLFLGKRDGLDPKDVSSICQFQLDATSQNETIFGEVVAIPMTPSQLLSEQDIAVERMHRAVKWAERDGIPVDVVGLGSLCSVVGSRGQALQEKLSVPVTTGNGATVWTIVENAKKVNPTHQPMIVLGSNSPVGKSVASLLMAEGIPVIVDSKRAIRKAQKSELLTVCDDMGAIFSLSSLIVGCGPTGPSFDISVLQSKSIVLDVALPHTFSGSRKDVTIYFAERLFFPKHWHRSGWGRVYHMLSGYGYQTVLACLIEPVILASLHQQEPFAQGRTLDDAKVKSFGDQARKLGFEAALSSNVWHWY